MGLGLLGALIDRWSFVFCYSFLRPANEPCGTLLGNAIDFSGSLGGDWGACEDRRCHTTIISEGGVVCSEIFDSVGLRVLFWDWYCTA